MPLSKSSSPAKGAAPGRVLAAAGSRPKPENAPAELPRGGMAHPGSNVGDACGISFLDDDLADFVDGD